MTDDLSPGRLGAVPAMIAGLVALVMGASVRVLSLFGRATLHDDDGFAVIAAILSILTLGVAALGRPRYHRNVFIFPWLGTAVITVIMAGLAVVEPEVRVALAPAALEAAGGVALLVAVTRWREVAIVRDHRWPALSGAAKSEIHHDDTTSALVPASGVAANDEVRVHAGDLIPVDGQLTTDSSRIDDTAVMGLGDIVEKSSGDPVFAGSHAEEALRVSVAARWDESWAAQRNERHDRLQVSQLTPDRTARTAAAALTLIGVAIAGMALTRVGPLAVAAWLPSVAAVLLATVALGPSLGRMRAHMAFMHGMHQAGLVVSRVRDLRALMHVRQWFVDPALLATPGPVEALAFGDISQEDLLVVAEALTREKRGVQHVSLAEVVKEDRRAEGAALRFDDDVYHGTVAGQRWFFGRPEAVKATLKLEVDAGSRGSLRFFEDKEQTPWVIGKPPTGATTGTTMPDADAPARDDGILGIIGVGVRGDEHVRSAAQLLKASMSGRGAEAKALTGGIVPLTSGSAGQRDGTLLAEYSAPPKAGLRVRAVAPRPARKLPDTGSPRMMRPALGAFARMLPYVRRHRATTTRNAWIVTLGVLAAASVIALTSTLVPSVAAAMGVGAVWLSSGTRPSYRVRGKRTKSDRTPDAKG